MREISISALSHSNLYEKTLPCKQFLSFINLPSHNFAEKSGLFNWLLPSIVIGAGIVELGARLFIQKVVYLFRVTFRVYV